MDKSETIREFIRTQFKANFDFTNKDARQKLFQDYCTSPEGKAADLDWNKHNTLFLSNFKKVCRELKKDPTMYGLSRDKVEFKSSTDEGSITIKPKPKGFKSPQGQPMPKPKLEDGTIKKEDLADGDGVIQWDTKLTGITLTTFYNLISKKWTSLLPLTDEEKDTLGTAWQPLFQKYLSKNWGLWGAPLIVTAGILSGKFQEARQNASPSGKKSEEKKPDEKQPDTNVETDEDARKRFEQWKATHKA